MTLTSPEAPLAVGAETLVLLNRPIRTDRGLRLSRFGDATWNLNPAIDDVHAPQQSIRWDTYPDPFVDAAKHYVFALINTVDDPPRLPFARSALPAVKTIWSDQSFLRHFLRWLISRKRPNLAAVTHNDLGAYLIEIQNLDVQSTAWRRRALVAVQRLHLYRDYLPPLHRLPAGRLWDGATAAELAQDPGPQSGENRTPRIHPDVMGPLLSAALFTTTTIAHDFLPTIKRLLAMRKIAHAVEPAARRAPARTTSAYIGSQQQLNRFLPALAASGLPVPTVMTEQGTQIDIVGLSVAGRIGQYNLRLPSVLEQIHSYRLPPHINHLVVTRFSDHNGHIWRSRPADAEELRRIVRHIVTAAFLVIAYLSGVRTGEALNLRRDCIRHDPDLDLLFMSGIQMKTGDAGRTRSTATMPWVVVDEVKHAVEVLEALTIGPLLFPNGKVFSPQWMNAAGTQSRSSGSMTADISSFIAWFNNNVAPRIQHPGIPADEHGPITAPRLRRTLAWHIVRRPGGLIAGATQYGHVRTQITQGYSGRADAGFQSALSFEDLLARIDHLHADSHRLADGEHVSGPSAADYTHRVSQASTFAGLTITTQAQERQLLSNPALNIHHGQLFTCVFKPEKARCVSATADTPQLHRCQVDCRNIAVTERDAVQLSAELARIDTTLASGTLPTPLHTRIIARRDALQAKLTEHRQSMSGS